MNTTEILHAQNFVKASIGPQTRTYLMVAVDHEGVMGLLTNSRADDPRDFAVMILRLNQLFNARYAAPAPRTQDTEDSPRPHAAEPENLPPFTEGLIDQAKRNKVWLREAPPLSPAVPMPSDPLTPRPEND